MLKQGFRLLQHFMAKAQGEGQWPLKKITKRQQPNQKKADYAYFKIDDPQVVKQLYNWTQNRKAAEEEIRDYLMSTLMGGSLIRVDPPWYKVDEGGHIESICFDVWMPLLHTGWTGKNGTNWMIPEKDTARG